MSSIFRPRRGKKTTAENQNIILKKGEVFFEYPDTGVGTGIGKIKMGDGINKYKDLPYFMDISNHTHDDRYYTETEIDSKLKTINDNNNELSGYFSSFKHDDLKIRGCKYFEVESEASDGTKDYNHIGRIFMENFNSTSVTNLMIDGTKYRLIPNNTRDTTRAKITDIYVDFSNDPWYLVLKIYIDGTIYTKKINLDDY